MDAVDLGRPRHFKGMLAFFIAISAGGSQDQDIGKRHGGIFDGGPVKILDFRRWSEDDSFVVRGVNAVYQYLTRTSASEKNHKTATYRGCPARAPRIAAGAERLFFDLFVSVA